MNFKEHSNAGLWASVPVMAVTAYLFLGTDLLFYAFMVLSMGACAWYGSLAPDLDTNSIISRWTARALLSYSCISLLKYHQPGPFEILGKYQVFDLWIVFYANLVFVAIKCTKHRGPTHKYIIPPILILAGFLTKYPWFSALGFGFIAHAILDKLKPDH